MEPAAAVNTTSPLYLSLATELSQFDLFGSVMVECCIYAWESLNSCMQFFFYITANYAIHAILSSLCSSFFLLLVTHMSATTKLIKQWGISRRS